MSGHPRTKTSREEEPELAAAKSDLVKELERLTQETETDKLLDALERELGAWAPEDEGGGEEEVIDRLNRELVSKSVFREGLDLGYHEEAGETRPIESEVRRGLDELRKLIQLGKPPGHA